MRKIKLDKETIVNKNLIEEVIKKHSSERNRVLKMKKYYDNLNDIMDRNYKDTNKPQNKLSHNYASVITDSYVGYLVGQPISYKSDNENLLEALNLNFLYNDEVDNNTTIAQEQSICGYAYELLYRDEEANVRFTCVNTEDMIVAYDNTLEEKELFALRFAINEKEEGLLYVYTKENEEVYEIEKNVLGKLVETNVNYFDDVPVCTYENNRQRMGDFEKVITLIDAYDKTQSDTANDFEYFTNALLVIAGVIMEDENSPLDFKNNRVLNFADTDSRAEYLIKNINDSALENYKNRLVEDIHKFSKVPNMADENFSANASGVALKFKFNGMELNASIKEAKFRKGLMKRIELITSFMNIKTNSLFTYTEITPIFTRNIPSNDVEMVNTVKQLYGIISDKTLLSQLPFVEDVQAELDALEKQKEDTLDYQDLGVADAE